MKGNFTKASIEGLKPRETRYEVGDTNTPGLSVRVTPNGIKTYAVFKRLNGKARAAIFLPHMFDPVFFVRIIKYK